MKLELKCSSMKLKERSEIQQPRKRISYFKHTVFVAEEPHWYSFPFSTRQISTKRDPDATLTVSSLSIPEGKSFNTGSSLEKWSKKQPRLKSGKPRTSYNENETNTDEDSLRTEFNISHYITEIDDIINDDIDRDSDITTHLEYEVHTDIQKLIMRSSVNVDEDFITEESKPIKKEKKNKNINTSKKREGDTEKKKNDKTIKFALSKPASPDTEKIIRVDVTSSAQIDDHVKSSTEKLLKDSNKIMGDRRCSIENKSKNSINELQSIQISISSRKL